MRMSGRKPRSPAGGKADKGGETLRRSAMAAGFVLLLLASSFAFAQQSGRADGSPRASVHDGVGRITFEWNGPVVYSVDVINDELVVRFDHPIGGDLRALVKPLSRYVKSVAVSGDRRTATFPLVHPAKVEAFTDAAGGVVVDIRDGAGPVSAPPVANPAPEKTAAAEPIPVVDAKAGEHDSFSRLVFSWPKTVDYKVEKAGGQATVTFSRQGRLDVEGLKATLPGDVSVLSSDSSPKGTVLVLGVPEESRLRHFMSDGKVVLDVVRPTGVAGVTSTGMPPSPQEAQPPSLKPLGPEEKPRLPSEVLAAAAKPGQAPATDKPATVPAGSEPKFGHVRADDAEPPKPASAPEVPKVRTEGVNLDRTPPGPKSDGDRVFSLGFPWDKPAAVAVFKRAGYLWVAFDRYRQADVDLLKRQGGDAVTFVEQLPGKNGTVLRMIVLPDYYPGLRQNGSGWTLDLIRHETVPSQPIPVAMPAQLASGPGISLKVPEAGAVLPVTDPEVGDVMLVVPVKPLGAGVYPGREAPEAELLPTLQGVAVVANVDGLDVRSSHDGVTIGLPGGMSLSRPSKGTSSGGEVAAAPAPISAAAAGRDDGRYFNVPVWMKSGPEKFPEERKAVLNGLVGLPEARRPQAHMDAARFLFANGYAPEALGLLTIAAGEDPTLSETGPYRALRGACNAAMERWDLALPDLDSPLIKDDPEALFWRAAAHAASSDHPGDYARTLAQGLALIGGYPKSLRWPLTAIAARSALAAGDAGAMQGALDTLDGMPAVGPQQGLSDYLHGAYSEMTGDSGKAASFYKAAMNGDNREYRARAALAETERLLKTGKIKPSEAVDRLDRLRFAWRSEDFEFNLLRRLAELKIASGDYADALRAARSLVDNYPDDPGEPAVAKMMSDTFEALYLKGAADTLPPISAIALYDEFRDLTPTGAKGDEMIRKLADRLASVDLLDRAAELLKHQVDFRLQGLDKARVGAQLALLDLLDQNAQGAIDAIQSSAMDGLPADLQDQRRHLLARALADADRVPEAVKTLDGDTSQEGGLLRAEIYWRKQDWPDAAAAFEGLVPRPEPGATLDDASARLVISWATALTLAGNDKGLASLRRAFSQGMENTPYKDGFTLLTSADHEVSDLSALKDRIKEAEGFLGFMSNYRNRLTNNGLSGIN